MISFLHFSHTATNFYAQLSCALSSQPPPALPAKGRAGEKAGGPSPPLYTKIFLIAANARSFYNNNNNTYTKYHNHYYSLYIKKLLLSIPPPGPHTSSISQYKKIQITKLSHKPTLSNNKIMSAATSNVSNELQPPVQLLFELMAPGLVSERGDGNIPLLQPQMNSEQFKTKILHEFENIEPIDVEVSNFIQTIISTIGTSFPITNLLEGMLPLINEDKWTILNELPLKAKSVLFRTIVHRHSEMMMAAESAFILMKNRTKVAENKETKKIQSLATSQTALSKMEDDYQAAQTVLALPADTSTAGEKALASAKRLITKYDKLTNTIMSKQQGLLPFQNDSLLCNSTMDAMELSLRDAGTGIERYTRVAKECKASQRQARGAQAAQDQAARANLELANRGDSSNWTLPEPGVRRNANTYVFRTDPYADELTLLQRVLLPHTGQLSSFQDFVQFETLEADEKKCKILDEELTEDPYDELPVNFVCYGFSNIDGVDLLDESLTETYIPDIELADTLRAIEWNLSLTPGDNEYQIITDKKSGIKRMHFRATECSRFLWRCLDMRVVVFHGIYFAIKGSINRPTDIGRHLWARQTILASRKHKATDFPTEIEDILMKKHKVICIISQTKLEPNWFDAICCTVTGMEIFMREARNVDTIMRIRQTTTPLAATGLSGDLNIQTIGGKRVQVTTLGPYRLRVVNVYPNFPIHAITNHIEACGIPMEGCSFEKGEDFRDGWVIGFATESHALTASRRTNRKMIKGMNKKVYMECARQRGPPRSCNVCHSPDHMAKECHTSICRICWTQPDHPNNVYCGWLDPPPQEMHLNQLVRSPPPRALAKSIDEQIADAKRLKATAAANSAAAATQSTPSPSAPSPAPVRQMSSNRRYESPSAAWSSSPQSSSAAAGAGHFSTPQRDAAGSAASVIPGNQQGWQGGSSAPHARRSLDDQSQK